MAVKAPGAARQRSRRSRLFWLIGVLGVVGIVYLCLPKSWFEIPDTNAPQIAPAAPQAAPPVPNVPGQADPASLETLRAAAQQHPLDFSTRSHYGMALAAAGRGPESLQEFLAAARLAPQEPVVYYNLGIYYLNTGQLDKADDAFCRELELLPGEGRAHYFRGLIFERRLKNVEAIAQYRLALALAPDFPNTYLSLAMELTRQAPDESRALIETYLRLTGNKALAYYVLSGAYKTRHQYDEALRYALMTVQLDPNDFGYQHNLGQIYFLSGRAAEADSALQRALTLAKDPTTVLIELGMNAQKGGKLPEAVDYLHRALAADPQVGYVHLYLAQIYPRMGDQAAAQREEQIFHQWQRADIARRHAQEMHKNTPSQPSNSGKAAPPRPPKFGGRGTNERSP